MKFRDPGCYPRAVVQLQLWACFIGCTQVVEFSNDARPWSNNQQHAIILIIIAHSPASAWKYLFDLIWHEVQKSGGILEMIVMQLASPESGIVILRLVIFFVLKSI